MSTHESPVCKKKHIHKTVGATPSERWRNRASCIVYIVLITLLFVGMVWWVATVGWDHSFPQQARWVLIAVTGLLACNYMRELLIAISTFRNDWILYKARSRTR